MLLNTENKGLQKAPEADLEELVLQVLLLEGVHGGGRRLARAKVGGRAPPRAQVAAVGQHLHRLLAQRRLLRVADYLLQPHLPHVLLHMHAHASSVPVIRHP